MLNGKTIEQILALVPKGTFYCMTGRLSISKPSRTATIPIPSGYTRSNCFYWLDKVSYCYKEEWWNSGDDSGWEKYYATLELNHINQDNGVVTLPSPLESTGAASVSFLYMIFCFK
ncbi:hypothetical protein [Phascolarctobacterium sp.]